MGVLSSKPAAPHLLRPCMDGDLDEVKRLVGRRIADGLDAKSYADAPDPDGNGTAVHGAVFGGHLDVVRFLAETCRADLCLPNGLGCTPLWVAAGYGRVGCLDYLAAPTAGGGCATSSSGPTRRATRPSSRRRTGDTSGRAAPSSPRPTRSPAGRGGTAPGAARPTR